MLPWIASRTRLQLVPGDKVLFVERANGEVVVTKAELAALAQAQEAVAGAAADFGVSHDDVQALVEGLRGRAT
jgi:antitoxin PrlF